MPAARTAIALTAKRNRRPPNATAFAELAAAIECRDVAVSVIIDAPQTPQTIRVCNVSEDAAVSVARIQVNANALLKIQNPSRSKQF